MKLSRDKIDVAVAKKAFTATNLAGKYGVSRARMNAILNSREVTAIYAGRMASSFEIDATKILED